MGMEGIIASTASAVGGAGIDAYAGHEAAKDQMHFQEKMSNSAHFREVQDLLRAGLNPVLSAKFGGASTPAGAMPPPTQFANSATRVKELTQQQQAIQAQVAKTENETKVIAENYKVAAEDAKNAPETNRKNQEILSKQIQLLSEQIRATKSSADSSTMDNAVKAILTQFYQENPAMVPLNESSSLIGTGANILKGGWNLIKKGVQSNPGSKFDIRPSRPNGRSKPRVDAKTGEILNR